jgi:hypothetical protein
LADFPELGHNTTMFEPQNLTILAPLLSQYPYLALAALTIWCGHLVIIAICKVLVAWLKRSKPLAKGA